MLLSENTFVGHSQYRGHKSCLPTAGGENSWLLGIQQISDSPTRICNLTEDSLLQLAVS